jgi:hypothetical protein
MTLKQLSNEVIKTFKAAKQNGQNISIDRRLPFVVIMQGKEDIYFFQGEEAESLINEADTSKLAKYCSAPEIILWQAQSW